MAVVTAPKKVETKDLTKPSMDNFAKMIDENKNYFNAVLPDYLKIERMVALAIASAQRNPKLLECTPSSIVLAFLQASELGLEPNSPMKEADILPYNNWQTKRLEAQFQPRYGGLIKLMMNTGLYEAVYAYNVYEGDKFKFTLGLHPDIIHEPGKEDDPQKIEYVYAVAKYKGGGEQFIVMTKGQVEKRRAVSKSWQAYQKTLAAGEKATPPVWEEWRPEMFLKTALKTLSNYISKSTEKAEKLARAVEMDNRTEIDQDVIDLITKRPDLKALDDRWSNKVTEKVQEPQKNAQEAQKQAPSQDPKKETETQKIENKDDKIQETHQSTIDQKKQSQEPESKENQAKKEEPATNGEKKAEVTPQEPQKDAKEPHVSQGQGGILYQRFMNSAFNEDDLKTMFGVTTVYRIPLARFNEAKKCFEDNPAPPKQ